MTSPHVRSSDLHQPDLGGYSQVIIDPRDLPSCCPPDQEPQYPPITSGAYLMSRYDATQPKFRDVIKVADAE